MSALKGAPIYQFMGGLDNIVSKQWTTTMRDVFKTLGANVKLETKPKFGHFMPLDPGRYVNKFLYENMPGTDIKWDETPDNEWAKNGYWGKFDQSLYTDGAKLADIHLREWGFFYYPENCIRGGCNL